MFWLVLIVLIVLLLWIITRWEIERFVKLSKKIKCDIKSYPLIGHAHLFIGDGQNLMNVFQRFGREAINNGGLTSLWIGGKYFVVAVDAADLEVIMKTSLEKGYIMRFPKEMAGNGIAFAPVPVWRQRRKFLSTSFSPRHLINFFKIFVEQSDIMMKQLKLDAGNGAFSVWKYMNPYSLDSICESALGVNLNSQINSKEPVMESFGTITKLLATRMLRPWLYPDAVFKLLRYQGILERHRGLIFDFINKVIQFTRKAMKENTESEKSVTHKMKYILELLIETSGGDKGYTDQELLEETLVMLLAGTDTSALGTSFVLTLLAKHEDVQEKVVQELQEVFGETDRQVTPEDLPRLKYLDAVIRETLRMYPPVPIIFREIGGDTKLPSGVTLIKGCGILINIWGIHRNPLYWGDDADKFRPERFIEAPLKHPAAYLAFSYGPRSCIGYRYAMMSMKTVLSTFLRNYRVLSAEGTKKSGDDNHEPLKTTVDIMMKDIDGFKVKIIKR